MIVLSAGFSSIAHALDPANQRNTLVGTRAAGLGGAYTALADDPAGVYYNPAGIAFGKEKDISVSVNAFQHSTLVYEKAIRGQPFREESQSFGPNFVGGLARFGPVAVGYAYFDLDGKAINQNDRFENVTSTQGSLLNYSRTQLEQSSLLMGGGGAAIRLGYLSVGYTGFGYYRTMSSSVHQTAEFNGGSVRVRDGKYDVTNMGIIHVPGIQLRGESVSLGVTVRMPQPISNKGTVSIDQIEAIVYSDGTTQAATAYAKAETNIFDERMPRTAQLGLAVFPSKWLLLSLDLLAHEGIPGDEEKAWVEMQDTANASLGLELALSWLTLRLGAFTNNSMYAEVKDGDANKPPKIDYQGYSAGLAVGSARYDASVTYVGQSGAGKAAIVEGSPTAQDVQGQIDAVLLGGRYKF